MALKGRPRMNEDRPQPPAAELQFEAILDEQQARWNCGERPSIEDFLARHPTLQANADAALDLIYQEFVIRRARGESPSPEDYLRRFPAWADALARQFAVDDALRPADETTIHVADVAGAAGSPAQTEHGDSQPGSPAVDRRLRHFERTGPGRDGDRV